MRSGPDALHGGARAAAWGDPAGFTPLGELDGLLVATLSISALDQPRPLFLLGLARKFYPRNFQGKKKSLISSPCPLFYLPPKRVMHASKS